MHARRIGPVRRSRAAVRSRSTDVERSTSPGDVDLARALHDDGLGDRFATFWRTRPSDAPSGEAPVGSPVGSPVEGAIVTGRTILLVGLSASTDGAALQAAADQVARRFHGVGVRHRVVASRIGEEELAEVLRDLHTEPPFDPAAPDSRLIGQVLRWLVPDLGYGDPGLHRPSTQAERRPA